MGFFPWENTELMGNLLQKSSTKRNSKKRKNWEAKCLWLKWKIT